MICLNVAHVAQIIHCLSKTFASYIHVEFDNIPMSIAAKTVKGITLRIKETRGIFLFMKGAEDNKVFSYPFRA